MKRNKVESLLSFWPKVCICIPTYNSASTIQEMINSILTQTYPNFVVHVSDNASTDNTVELIEAFKDLRVIVHRHAQNVGGEGNFNRCIEYSEGKYMAIFHADDVYEPQMIMEQVACLEDNLKIGAVFTAAHTIDTNGVVTGLIGIFDRSDYSCKVVDFSSFMKAILKRGNFVICPSGMVRTEIYKNEIACWKDDIFRSSSDLDVWFRIASNHSLAFLSEPLMRYRLDSNQFSNKVRLRTQQADFFLVTEFYLAQDRVWQLMSNSDFRNYRMLVINDLAWRAINYYSSEKLFESNELLHEIIKPDVFLLSMFSRRDFLMFIVCIGLQLTIAFGMQRFGAKVLVFFRRKLNK